MKGNFCIKEGPAGGWVNNEGMWGVESLVDLPFILPILLY